MTQFSALSLYNITQHTQWVMIILFCIYKERGVSTKRKVSYQIMLNFTWFNLYVKRPQKENNSKEKFCREKCKIKAYNMKEKLF